jgi:N-acyl-D-aspartate/D-glutamate deacylase
VGEVDLVIRGGTVVDGTGCSSRTADVAVHDGVIVEVGAFEGTARRTIDASGAIVAPGFVDVHTHYDGQATWDDRMIPSSWHGVTTVVMGNCGVGFAPVHTHHHDALIELMEGVEDIPGTALHEGLPWAWSSFPDYLAFLSTRRYDIDIAAQVPHAALRLHAMGERGARGEQATADDISCMARLARDAVQAGAIGFTTSRTLNHKSSKGDPTPSLKASRDELLAIAAAIGTTGKGVLQVVSDFADFDEEWATLRSMAEVSGRPLSISLASAGIRIGGSTGSSKSYRRTLHALEQANNAGLDMRAQVAARAIGLLFGFQATTNPFANCPSYRVLLELPCEARLSELRRSEVRAAIVSEVTAYPLGVAGGFEKMFLLGDPANYEPDASTSIAARAALVGTDPAAMAYDEMLADDGSAMLYFPILNFSDGNLDAVHEMLTHPHTIPGLADGGAHVGTICDGSFPTTLLAHWVRDRNGERLDLPFVIRAQSYETALAVGLHDRGLLSPGFIADINVIDLERLTLHPPTMAFDLPAGGKRLLQRADGYVHTIKHGVEIYADGVDSGARPGHLVRSR